MAKGNSQKTVPGSALELESQHWAAVTRRREAFRTLALLLPKLLSGKLHVPKLPD